MAVAKEVTKEVTDKIHRETAIRMLKKNVYTDDEICEIAGVSKEEFEEIKAEINHGA